MRLAEHILAMRDDAYLMGHPEWAEIVREAEAAIPARFPDEEEERDWDNQIPDKSL